MSTLHAVRPTSRTAAGRQSVLDRAAGYYEGGVFLSELARLVAVPTESEKPRGAPYLAYYLTEHMRPAVDRAIGPLQPAVRVAVGTREYDAIRESVAAEAVDYTITPMQDPEFNRRQSERIRTLVAARMKEMAPSDFTEMLRTVMKEDEWLLYLHGAVLGFGAGLVHLAIFG